MWQPPVCLLQLAHYLCPVSQSAEDHIMSKGSIFYCIIIIHCVISSIITVHFLKDAVNTKLLIFFKGFSLVFMATGSECITKH